MLLLMLVRGAGSGFAESIVLRRMTSQHEQCPHIPVCVAQVVRATAGRDAGHRAAAEATR